MTVQFLFPRSRQFPHDEVCEQIVRALAARNFTVPGFVVELLDYGSGAQKLRYVSYVRSDRDALDLASHDVRLHFGRPQGLLIGGQHNDIAAISDVQMPRRALTVFADESGPVLSLYVGSDWESDRGKWWRRPNARLNRDPRRCLDYCGSGGYFDTRQPELRSTSDSREYQPADGDPTTFETEAVIATFTAYLRDVVLPAIVAYPEAVSADPDPDPASIPMPFSDKLFTYATYGDLARLKRGKQDPAALAPPHRYGLDSRGTRLAPSWLRRGADLPEVAFDNFRWCTPTPRLVDELCRGASDEILLCVRPADASEIYVADHGLYTRMLAAGGAKLRREGRDVFTDAEVDEFLRARACSVVPITAYRGNFEDPIYLIHRELTFDEVELPISLFREGANA